MRYRWYSTFLLGAALLVTVDSARAFEVEGGAALRETAVLFRPPWEAPLPDDAFGLAEIKLRPFVTVREENVSVSLAAETRVGLTAMNTALLTQGVASAGSVSVLGVSAPLRRFDLTWKHISDPHVAWQTSIERADVFVHTGPVDIDLGRQPISLGTSRFVGVLDVIAPFAPGDLDSSYKPGVDAVRVRTGFGMAGEAELLAVAADPWEDSAIVGRLRDSFAGIDLEVLGGRFRQRNFGGLAFEGDAGIVGVWGELALFQRKSEPHRAGWSKAAFSGVAGVDKNLPGNVLLSLGAFYHDFGARDTAELTAVSLDEPFLQGWSFLRAAGYGVVTGSYEFHPLVNGSAAGLINLVDGSTLWQPRITVSMADNADLTLYGWIGVGPKPRVEGLQLVTPSEYGAIPDGGGLYARWYL